MITDQLDSTQSKYHCIHIYFRNTLIQLINNLLTLSPQSKHILRQSLLIHLFIQPPHNLSPQKLKNGLLKQHTLLILSP